MGNHFKPHQIEWTREISKRFWDYYGTKQTLEETYFSYQVGEDVLDYTQKRIRLAGKVLDFGCGPGFFMEALVKRNISTWGIDFSEQSIDAAKERLKGYLHFEGIILANSLPTEIESESFDVVFLIETIEHLLFDDLTGTLNEIYRILKPGGFVVITTPNEEDLLKNTTLCPECGCIFHQMQHVSSWSVSSLVNLMADFGFLKVACKATKFRSKSMFTPLIKIFARVYKSSKPHLIYIGQKT
jgi:2-polyprenyl-3-methyl-5-hydroxy-6-metoxy-1,4-benzoquinol methylase